MKISIGANIIKSAWGGGNRFAKLLFDYLQAHSVETCTDLAANDLDIIILIEPDKKLRISSYNHRDIQRYLRKQNSRCVVVHRINNTSAARDDKKESFNRYRIRANSLVADHTVFISNWVYQQYKTSGYSSEYFSVIYNGGRKVDRINKHKKKRGDVLSIVTHHWSNNYNKGFDIYERLDNLLSKGEFASKVKFTYVGRLNDSVKFKNTACIAPLFGDDLNNELSKHDIYLSAAINEAGGMHHIEGALCGLPLLYRNSGALPEYCQGFGVSFDGVDDFEEALNKIIENFDYYSSRMIQYNNTSEKMCSEYLKLFDLLYKQKDEVIASRARRNVGFLRIVKLKILFFFFKILNRLGIS